MLLVSSSTSWLLPAEKIDSGFALEKACSQLGRMNFGFGAFSNGPSVILEVRPQSAGSSLPLSNVVVFVVDGVVIEIDSLAPKMAWVAAVRIRPGALRRLPGN